MLSGPRGAVLSRYGYRCLLVDKMQIEKTHGLVSAAPESGSQRKISASALQPCKLKIREMIRNLEVEEDHVFCIVVIDFVGRGDLERFCCEKISDSVICFEL